MFGYVIIDQQNLSPEATARYQASYCGLCHTLSAQHGLTARLTLSYDLTFLNLLLASLYEDEHPINSGSRTCPIHPFKKRGWRTTHQTAYCADMSIALQYYAAKDKWLDDKNPAALAFMQLLEQKRKVVDARYPVQCNAIAAELAKLSAFEAENSQDIEAVSSCFGDLMAAIFVMQEDHWANDLRSIGFYLGKYIYLMDAYEDLAKDEKKGSYNPLKALSKEADYQERICEILQHLMGRCAQCFERLPCVADAEILQNILYSGVWLRYVAKQKKDEAQAQKQAKAPTECANPPHPAQTPSPDASLQNPHIANAEKPQKTD